MKLKIMSLLSFGVLLAGCAADEPPVAQVVQTQEIQQTPCTEKGTNAEFVNPNVVGDRVFFDFDKADLNSTSKDVLARQVKWLQDNPSYGVTIAGFCDERGTYEYNFELGIRRADAVKNALQSHGLSGTRIKGVVSHSNRYALVPGNNEEAWAQNRVAITQLMQDNQFVGTSPSAAPAAPAAPASFNGQ